MAGPFGRGHDRLASLLKGLQSVRWGASGRWLRLGVIGFTGTWAVCWTIARGETVNAEELPVNLPGYPWGFDGALSSFDHAAIRRGWQVYKQVCHTCHSLRFIRFGDLIGVSHTADEVKAIAEEYQVEDGPDEEGNYFMRPGRPSDKIPSPFPNEQAARAANSGAYPVDLNHAILARRNGTNYVFSLLTGWMDEPAGFHIGDGQYFNVYFPGGATAMAQPLYDDIVEYDDGTPATASQMAKDVVEFLYWAAAMEHDTRKLWTIKALGVLVPLVALGIGMYRRLASFFITRRVVYVPRSKRKP